MSAVWWIGLGVVVSLLSSLLQKWSVYRMQPGSTKITQRYFISGFLLRLFLIAAVLFLALDDSFLEMVFCVFGMIIGKWGMLFFWLRQAKKS